MNACVQITSLSKRYGSVAAVQDLSIEIQSGEVLGLLGPNGAGKSTTLYMLAGLVRPTSGHIAIFGKELHRHYLDIAPSVGVMVERPALHDYLSVRDNLLLSARLAGRQVTVERTLEMVGLRTVASRRVRTLSTGMRQRLGLAQALLLEPALLILDEPANGLDPEAAQEVLALLRQLADEANVTILISSHMLNDVEQLCDRIAILHEGRLAACDRTDNLLSYDQTQVQVLLDAPEAAAKRLLEQPWIESLTVGPGRIDVVLREPNPHQLIAFLVTAGYRLAGVTPKRRTLHDYFMETIKP